MSDLLYHELTEWLTLSVNDCIGDVDCIVDCIVQCYWKWPGYVIIKIESRLKSCCLNVKINQLINTCLLVFLFTLVTDTIYGALVTVVFLAVHSLCSYVA